MNTLSAKFKTVLFYLSSVMIGLIIAISYDIYDGGITFAGEYQTYYWSDIIQYVKGLF